MRDRVIVAILLMLPLSLVGGAPLALAGDIPAPRQVVQATNSHHLLLVFDRGSGPSRYRVAGAATDAAEIEGQINALLDEGYDYHGAIPVSEGHVPTAVGVPGVTSNVIMGAIHGSSVVDVSHRRLLLVFANDQLSDPYHVVESSTDAADVERHLNAPSYSGPTGAAYEYHAAIPVTRRQVTFTGTIELPTAVGVPGVTSNVLGERSVTIDYSTADGGEDMATGRLLLVFARSGSAGGQRVVQSAATAEQVEGHLNRMAGERYYYHTTIAIDAAPEPLFITMSNGVVSVGSPTTWPSTPPSETEWVSRPGAATQYRIVGAGTWEQCEAAARDEGAHLVTINDADEQAWLADTYGDLRFVWIGFTDEGSEGEWRWASGEATDFTNWAPSAEEPNNLWDGGENFAQMNWSSAGLWNDLGPASPEWGGVTHGIIERPLAAE